VEPGDAVARDPPGVGVVQRALRRRAGDAVHPQLGHAIAGLIEEAVHVIRIS
jgi:hypothetical protein